MKHPSTRKARQPSPCFRLSRAAATVLACATLWPGSVRAQWVAGYSQTYLRAPYNGAFQRQDAAAARLISASAAARSALLETLWSEPAATSMRAEQLVAKAATARLLDGGMRLNPETRLLAHGFTQVVPEAIAALEWADAFRRQLYDLLNDRRMSEVERDGRVSELLGYYQARRDLALAASPKTPDLVETSTRALAFRRRLTAASAMLWTVQWFETAMLEPGVFSPSERGAKSEPRIVDRFREMVKRPQLAPTRMPFAPAIAPTFSQRYPSAAAVIDNTHLLEGALADILVDRETPRSAKRQEILRTVHEFQADSTNVVDYALWIRAGDVLGLANMGGSALSTNEPVPSELGVLKPITGLLPPMPARSAAASGMAGMSDMSGMPNMGGADSTLGALIAIHERMMSDPVIRERVATDPVLQRMLAALGPAITAGGNASPGMPGMNMSDMPKSGADTSAAAMAEVSKALSSGTPEERQRALEFAVRLLSDPTIEARIHQYPALHALWSDPEVQRRLAELKRARQDAPRPRP